MSNRASGRRKPPATPRTHLQQRPVNELEFTVVVAPPDGEPLELEEGAELEEGRYATKPVTISVALRRFTLHERQLAKRAMALMAQPPGWEDVVVVHAWVVWKRTHPESSLSEWMEHIEWGDLLDGFEVEPAAVAWDTTPEGYDPKV